MTIESFGLLLGNNWYHWSLLILFLLNGFLTFCDRMIYQIDFICVLLNYQIEPLLCVNLRFHFFNGFDNSELVNHEDQWKKVESSSRWNLPISTGKISEIWNILLEKVESEGKTVKWITRWQHFLDCEWHLLEVIFLETLVKYKRATPIQTKNTVRSDNFSMYTVQIQIFR